MCFIKYQQKGMMWSDVLGVCVCKHMYTCMGLD